LIKYSAHLTRLLVEGISSYSPYHGARLFYVRGYDPVPITNVDLTSKMDLEKAISELHKSHEISDQELMMLKYVISDGRLSRRDISLMIKEEEGYWIDQRTISRRLDTAYQKIQKYLGFEYSDARVFKMIAKKWGRPEPYILSDEEIDKIQQIWSRL